MRNTILLVLLLAVTQVFSQKCDNTLTGIITDLHDGSALVDATVIVAGSEIYAQTDLDGEFKITNLCAGTYSIQIAHPGCLTQGFTVNISGNMTKRFRMEHHLEELNQIVLRGKSSGESTKTLVENQISTEDLERFSSGSIGDALNSLSGVASLNTGSTVVKPMINGLHSSRVVIINKGVRMEDQEWGAEHAPNIDINSVGNLTLIKGAGALQYSGDAVGGIIVAEAPTTPVLDSLFGKTLLTGATNGQGLSVATQLTKTSHTGWYGSIQGSFKRFGDFEAPDYVLSNTGVIEGSGSFTIGMNHYDQGFEAYYSIFKTEIGILRASHLSSAQDLVRAINSDVPLIIEPFTYDINAPKQDATHQVARINGFKRIDGLGKLSLHYDFQRNDRLEYDIRRGDDRDKASLDLELDTHTLMLDLDSFLNDDLRLKTGLMGSYQDNFADPSTGVRRLIPDYEKFDFGVYAVADYQFRDNWMFEAGARLDYTYLDALKFYRTSLWESKGYDVLFPEFVVREVGNQILTNPQLHYPNLSATLGATYSFNNSSKLFMNYSMASRAPNPSELFSEGLHHSASRIEIGELDLNSEVAHNVSLSYQFQNEVWNISVNSFVNTIQDFIVIEPTGVQQTIRGSFQVWEYRQTDAQLLGFDWDVSYLFAKNFRFNHQFSFLKGYDRIQEDALIDMPPVNTQNEIVYQNPNIKDLRISLQSNYVFRQNEYPDNNFEVFIPETGTTELVDVSTPPDAYHLLNFSSSITLRSTNKSKFTVGLDITNMMNTSYRNYLNRLRYYSDDLGRNFLINLKFNY
ncbi:TonB-dependent receptor [Lutimonas sp.]|uniref:TonB-dependent receptor n=1 Tax=Lutimonas sp. TaxID=1872403 RepID=UPI003C75A645